MQRDTVTEPLGRSILSIPQDRVAAFGELQSYLMFPATLQADGDQRNGGGFRQDDVIQAGHL